MRVIPNSKVEEVVEGNPPIVKVREPPERGRANTALLRVLSKHFGCRAKLIGGFKSRQKLVKLE